MKDGDLKLCDRRWSLPMIRDQSCLTFLHSILEWTIHLELFLRGVLILRQNLHIGHYYGLKTHLTSEMKIPRICPIYFLPHGWFKCILYHTAITYVCTVHFATSALIVCCIIGLL